MEHNSIRYGNVDLALTPVAMTELVTIDKLSSIFLTQNRKVLTVTETIKLNYGHINKHLVLFHVRVITTA